MCLQNTLLTNVHDEESQWKNETNLCALFSKIKKVSK